MERFIYSQKVITVLIFIFAFLAYSHVVIPAEETKIGVVESYNNFGIEVFNKISFNNLNENIFISPLSISIALTMTYNGADGNTGKEMAEVLRLEDIDIDTLNKLNQKLLESLNNSGKDVELAIANSLWARENISFNKVFINRCHHFYNAEATTLDFSDPKAPYIINGWVSENTKKMIKEIVSPPINPQTIMFLINAIYFKADWFNQFDEDQTRKRLFLLPTGKTKSISMMTHQSSPYNYYENEKLQAINIPYRNTDISMYIFLPSEKSSLSEFIDSLNPESWHKWMTCFEDKEYVNLNLPRFKLEYDIKLKETLISLGMVSPFDPSSANFDKMTNETPPLWIDEVKHKTYLEVNEKGTVAAGATSVEMRMLSVRDYKTMEINRPFFICLRDNTSGIILFLGAIYEPLEI
ncbi:MAG: serpin family protein [candidate division Zixibacteria bacterium]|nr:serpin family protein [candidate division Zixibacteria bacterium]